MNVRKIRARVLSSSESETESVQASPREIAVNGTKNSRTEPTIQTGKNSRRVSFWEITLAQYIQRHIRSTRYAKKSIMKDKVISAFSLLIDSHMLQRISCIESEFSRVLGKKWMFTETKLKAFLRILYGEHTKRKIWNFHICGIQNGDQSSFPAQWVGMSLLKY